MLAAFASVDDLERRWRPLAVDERERAAALLADAAALIMAEPGFDVLPGDEVQSANLEAVSCSMVARALSVSDDMYGVTQVTQTAGPYSGSRMFANATGDLYLAKSERRRLGIDGQRIGSILPAMDGLDAGR